MNLKNAKEAAESQQRENAAERQRREKGVPVNAAAVNTTGPRASVTSGATTSGPAPGVNPVSGDIARPLSGVAARDTADGVCGGTFIHGELYVVFTDSKGRKLCVPYVPSGAPAPLGQPCAHAAGTAYPCGAPLSR